MSDVVGPLTFGKKEEQIFLGREIAQHQDYSERTAMEIDEEVKRIVTENYDRALVLLEDKRNELNCIAEELLVREVLDGDQVRRIVAGLPLEKPQPKDAKSEPTAATDDDSLLDKDPDERTPIVQPLNKPLPQE